MSEENEQGNKNNSYTCNINIFMIYIVYKYAYHGRKDKVVNMEIWNAMKEGVMYCLAV